MNTENIFDESLFETTSFITKHTKKLTPRQKELLDFYNQKEPTSPVVGQIYNLTYTGETTTDFLFDGGYKDYIRVEKRNIEAKYLQNTQLGDMVDVLIMEIPDKTYLIKGSISAIYENRAQKELVSLGDGDYVMGDIKESSPAGYKVQFVWNGVTLSGFMPNTLAGINKLSNPDSIVGKTLELGVESFSRDEGTYIVSRRKYLQSMIPGEIKKLQVGNLYRGVVTGTTEFGIFVEWNECLTGMIHKTNMNPDYKISQIHPGMLIEFYIKEIVRDKIILTQVLKDSLWDFIKVGMVMDGVVKEVKSFGTLITLDEETIGLVHNSEMEKHSLKYSTGQEVKVKIIAVDRLGRKIFLTQAKS